jgi:hypothetical protein
MSVRQKELIVTRRNRWFFLLAIAFGAAIGFLLTIYVVPFVSSRNQLVEDAGRPRAATEGMVQNSGQFLSNDEKLFVSTLMNDGRLDKILKYLAKKGYHGGIRLDTDACRIRILQRSNHYMPSSRAIEICLADITSFRDRLTRNGTRTPNSEAADALLFVVLHELSHALIHDESLVVLGREEDAADEIATLLAIENEMPLVAESAANFFDTMPHSDNPSDAHTDAGRRAYQVRCIARGSRNENEDGTPSRPKDVCPTLFFESRAQFFKAMADVIDRRNSSRKAANNVRQKNGIPEPNE